MINLLTNYQIIANILVFFTGASLASFLNVLVDRLPQKKSIMGRSYCNSCKKTIAWYDLIPIASFFFLKGKCRNCKSKISLKHPLSELVLGLIFILFLQKSNFQLDWLLFKNLFLSCLIFIITMTDINTQLIYDEPLFLIIIIGLLTNFLRLPYYLGSAILFSSLFYLIYYFSKGKAMGYADVKYVFAFGFIIPIYLMLISLYVTFLTGGLVSAILLLSKQKKMKSQIAFGPFLSIGFLFSLYLS